MYSHLAFAAAVVPEPHALELYAKRSAAPATVPGSAECKHAAAHADCGFQLVDCFDLHSATAPETVSAVPP